jgi:hypothetical protein
MVLVDPAIPDQTALLEQIAPLFLKSSRALDEKSMTELEQCAHALRNGTLRPGTRQFEACTGVDPTVPALARLSLDPARLLTQASTIREFDSDAAPDSREVVDAKRHYGDMPLIVLTAGRDEETVLSSLSHLSPDTPGADTPAELAQLREQVVRYLRDGCGAGHDAYAALSTRGRDQLVPDSTHAIQSHKPEVVVAAVIEVLDEARPSAPHEP